MQIARLLVSLAILLPQASTAALPESVRLVAPLKDQEAVDGCSWSASSQDVGRGFVFLAEYDDSRSFMNIDGSDLELALVAERGTLKKVGDAMERAYRADGVLVKAKYKATWVCSASNESCEVTRYKVTFDVSKGSRREVVKATGDVGC